MIFKAENLKLIFLTHHLHHNQTHAGKIKLNGAHQVSLEHRHLSPQASSAKAT